MNEILEVLEVSFFTGETQADWAAFANNSIGYGDMRQVYPLLNAVMVLSSTDTGFQTTSKLAVIHGIFDCTDWRRRDLYYKVLELIEPRLMDSYRDHVAYLLSICFRHDVKLPNIEKNIIQGPSATEFFQKYYPQCLSLMTSEGHTTLGLLNLFKTIVKTIVTHVSSLAALRPDILVSDMEKLEAAEPSSGPKVTKDTSAPLFACEVLGF